MGAAVLGLFVTNKEKFVVDMLIEDNLDYNCCETVLFEILGEMSKERVELQP